MSEVTAGNRTYQTIELALYCMAERYQSPPTLAELADQAGLSEYHFQKLFTQWAGISPKRFSQFLSKEYLKQLLGKGMKPLDACYQAGLSGPGRMHDLLVSTEAVTPAQYRSSGKDMVIYYGTHQSPFGPYLLAVTDRGICQLNFISGNIFDNSQQLLTELKQQWSLSTVIEEPDMTSTIHNRFGQPTASHRAVSLFLKGTNFQIQVWQALLKIPFGSVTAYEDVAKLTGRPEATRACASAIARNNIGWLIPCHRVIRKIGETGQYRWGGNRKKIMLGYEAAHLD
jgi:AraC family transcriptional regulator of adaptative response/methylated-DNA-[protein]-cysteine methyltransferase